MKMLGRGAARLQNGRGNHARTAAEIAALMPSQQHKEAMFLLFGKAYAGVGNQPETELSLEAVSQFGSVEAYVEYAIWFECPGEFATAEMQRDED